MKENTLGIPMELKKEIVCALKRAENLSFSDARDFAGFEVGDVDNSKGRWNLDANYTELARVAENMGDAYRRVRGSTSGIQFEMLYSNEDKQLFLLSKKDTIEKLRKDILKGKREAHYLASILSKNDMILFDDSRRPDIQYQSTIFEIIDVDGKPDVIGRKEANAKKILGDLYFDVNSVFVIELNVVYGELLGIDCLYLDSELKEYHRETWDINVVENDKFERTISDIEESIGSIEVLPLVSIK